MLNSETVAALIAALPAELYTKLQACADEAQRLEALEQQHAALRLDATKQRREMQTTYRDSRADRYADFDWRASLCGAPVDFDVRVLDLHFFVRPPSGARTRAVQRFAAQVTTDATPVGKDAKTGPLAALHPIAPHEAILLAWLTSTQGVRQTIDVSMVPPEVLLGGLRDQPEQVLIKVATECEELQTWLSVQLELDGGKS